MKIPQLPLGIGSGMELARDMLVGPGRDYVQEAAQQHVRNTKENLLVARLAFKTTLDFKGRELPYEDTLLLGKHAMEDSGMAILDLDFSEEEQDQLRQIL